MSHYETLEVSRNASPEVIRAAYKSLIQRYHPDRNTHNSETTAKAQQVTVAYGVLSSPDSRAAYDATLSVANQLKNDYGLAQEKTVSSSSPKPPTNQTKSDRASILQRVAQPQENGGSRALVNFILIAIAFVIGLSLWISVERRKQEELSEFSLMAMRANTIITDAEKLRQENDNKKKKEKAAQDEAVDLSRRTLNLFPKNVSLNLIRPHTYPPQFSGQVLFIPQITVIIGKINSERVIANVWHNQQVLIQEVFEQLSRVENRILITVDAEAHIKKVIQSTINKITLGTGYQKEDLCKFVSPENPVGLSEWQCQAIEAVKLPQSFVVRDRIRDISPTATNPVPLPNGNQRSLQRLHPSMSKEEVYRILGKPNE